MNIKNEKFLITYFETENKIGDIVLTKLLNKYSGYQLLLKNKNIVYFIKDNNLYEINLEEVNFEYDDNKNKKVKELFEQFWERFYVKYFLDEKMDSNFDNLLAAPLNWLKTVSLSSYFKTQQFI